MAQDQAFETIGQVDCRSQPDRMPILELFDVFQDNRDTADDLLDILVLWFRDLLVLVETGKRI